MTAGEGAHVPEPELTIIVDGANVVGSRPDGWWRDRAGAAVRLHDELSALATRGAAGIPAAQLATDGDGDGATDGDGDGDGGASASPTQASPRTVAVILVLEGAARPAGPRIAARTGGAGTGRDDDTGTVQVVSAPGSGDDEIVRLARSRPGHSIVVTSDRELRRRSVAAGAQVAGPSWLRARL